MASFGSFETEREVYSDSIYTVYGARKQGGAVEEYAVKLFLPPASGLEAELAAEAAGRDELEQARLRSISTQQQAGAASKFIAPILERGNDARGVWYVTRFYQRSVNKMMSGKVALPRASLEHIIRSIAQGSLDLKRVCGRSHGDIRPTNVQVSKSEKLREAEVVLSDPLPGGSDEARQYELNDLRAVGEIILQLLLQRVISSEEIALLLPIGPSAEWTRIFGSDASDWLAICNRLLDPELASDQFTLENLVERLDELKPKRQISPKLMVAGAAALVLIGALGFWSLRPRLQTVEVTSDPSGATIVVDQAKESGTTPLRLKLKRGDHLIEARHDHLGLAEEATNCLVETGTAPRVHFQFAYGSVAIKSQPPGATILRDGAIIDKTTTDGRPFIISPLAPGLVKYQLKLDQYEPAEVTGVVKKSQRLELVATLRPSQPKQTTGGMSVPKTNEPTPPPSSVVVELRAEPGPALVFDSERRELGEASADVPLKLKLAPGSYSLTARAEGLDDVQATLPIESRGVNQHTFVFDYGTVNWAAEPVPATVSRGSLSQETPATFIQKPGVAKTYTFAAPGYQTLSSSVTVANKERKSMVVKLLPQIVSVELLSDPPGAEFLGENGVALARSESNNLVYHLPWGPTNLVARYAALGSITNHVELTSDQRGSRVQFKFDYGTLVLTNLPPDIAVYEGDAKVGSAADNWVYQKSGSHLYALRGRTSPQRVQKNISPGLNFLMLLGPQKAWKNGLGMSFAWVPNLPGGGDWPGQSEPGGWVGATEVTQGQYKKMDGRNPSVYRDVGDNYPVENVTYAQALSFCQWLSSSDTSERSGWRYTLPTDDQFAFFAGDADRLVRVTNEGRMSTTQDDIFSPQRGLKIPAAANLIAARTHPEMVGSTKQPNQYGLYDVVGNVSEWIARSNPRENVYAGGSYLNFSSKTLGGKARERGLEKGPNIGFRMILVPPQ